MLKAACAGTNTARGDTIGTRRKKLLQFRKAFGCGDERDEFPLRRMLFDHDGVV